MTGIATYLFSNKGDLFLNQEQMKEAQFRKANQHEKNSQAIAKPQEESQKTYKNEQLEAQSIFAQMRTDNFDAIGVKNPTSNIFSVGA